MSNWLLILPPALWAMTATALGRWLERRFFSTVLAGSDDAGLWGRFSTTLIVNLLFFGLLATFVLFVFQPMLPFQGARAGLALGLAVYVFGLIPARLLDAPHRGWDHAALMMLVDFLRTVGALTLAGWLLEL